MKTCLQIISTVFAAALFTFTGLGIAAPTPNPAATTADTSDTATIAKDVQHKLLMLPWYGVFDNLVYTVTGTNVTLTGQVISEHDQTKYDAERFVKSIPGVTNVVNNIEVLPPSQFDGRIRRAEYRAIFSKSDLGRYTEGAHPQFHIIVKNGHVTLDGVVMNQMDKTVAGIAANSVPGVFSVTNNLRVGS